MLRLRPQHDNGDKKSMDFSSRLQQGVQTGGCLGACPELIEGPGVGACSRHSDFVGRAGGKATHRPADGESTSEARPQDEITCCQTEEVVGPSSSSSRAWFNGDATCSED